jgi:uncharacterized membrane protein YvlD (DUF360 family)
MTEATRQQDYGARPAAWAPARPRIHLLALLAAWLLSAAALLIAAWIIPGASTRNFGGALVAALVIALLNGLLPPLVAALRLPFTLLTGFLLVLVLDALMLLAADNLTNGDISVDSFWSALGVGLAAAAIGVALDVIAGSNDDDTYTFREIQRIARAITGRVTTDAPGIVFLRRRPAPGCGRRTALCPRPLAHRRHSQTCRVETDLSQTGASQAGILLGSNEDIPAFWWRRKPRR